MKPNSMFGVSVDFAGWDWIAWRNEVERRIIALEGKQSLAEALDSFAKNGSDEQEHDEQGQHDVDITVDLSPAFVQDEDGTVTVSLTPATGGVFGASPDYTDNDGMPVYTDSADADPTPAPAPVIPVAATPARKRAPRVSPTDAKLRVQQALTSAQSTIRGITVWEVANGWGTPLTTSQVRAALTSLEQEGRVYVAGKRGKQEVWSLRS